MMMMRGDESSKYLHVLSFSDLLKAYLYKSESQSDFFSLIFVTAAVVLMQTVNWIPYRSDVASALI